MTPDKLQERIQANQVWLLNISEQIKDSVSNTEGKRDIYGWINDIIRSETEILGAFDLQQDHKICKAVLTLLDLGSSYREPLIKTITYRVVTYTNAAVYLRNYIKDNASIDKIIYNLQPLIELVDTYTVEYLESLTIENVHTYLLNAGLKEFIAHFKETDIQIVLKAIKGDMRREMKTAKLKALLDFLFIRLEANAQRHKVIETSRHAWWSLKDTLLYREADWLAENKDKLKNVLNSLIQYGIYFNRKNTSTSVIDILETTSIYYERVWVLENAIQVLKKVETLQEVFTLDHVRELRHFIQTEIDLHERAHSRDNNLRNVQCDLICLYFILHNYNLIYNDVQLENSANADDTKFSSGLTPEEIFKAISK